MTSVIRPASAAEASAEVDDGPAIAELHRKKPDLDLSSLLPAIEKLTKSDNAVLRTEAERTRLVLTQK